MAPLKEIVGADYLKNVQALQRIRDVAGGELKLPQICVLGDQSSGKSSLLSAATGISFPASAGICTRMPTVVECKFQEGAAEDEYWIQDGRTKGGEERCGSLEQLRTRIEEVQNAAIAALKKEEKARSKRRGRPHEEERANAGAEDSSSDSSAQESPPRANGHGRKRGGAVRGCTAISLTEIRVRVEGPKQMDIVVVDLPGIIHNGEGAQETRDLIRRYCEPRQTLMLVVSEAKQDEQGIEAKAMAKDYDPQGERTLHVLTKFDVFDSPGSMERARAWVVEGASNDTTGLGCHAVVCRVNGGDAHAAEEELKRLEGLPANYAGVEALKRRLPPLFATLIAKMLPNLQAQVAQRQREAREALRRLGDEPVDRTTMIQQFQATVAERAQFERWLTPPIDELREAIHATGPRVTKRWTDGHFSQNAFQFPMFQGNDAVLACMGEIAKDWWSGPVETYFSKVTAVCEESVSPEGDMLSTAFATAVKAEWTQFCRGDMLKRFGEKMREARLRERGFGTMNHYLDAKLMEGIEVMPTEFLESISKVLPEKIDEFRRGGKDMRQRNIAAKAKHAEAQTKYAADKNAYESRDIFAPNKLDIPSKPEAPTLETLKTESELIREFLESERDIWVKRHKGLDIMAQQKVRVFESVRALWAVEKKTFTDYVHKLTRDEVIDRREKWLHQDLPFNKNITEHAVEDEDTAAKRDMYKRQIREMNECDRELLEMSKC